MSSAAAAYIHVYMYKCTYILLRHFTCCCSCCCCVRRLCCCYCCAKLTHLCVCLCVCALVYVCACVYVYVYVYVCVWRAAANFSNSTNFVCVCMCMCVCGAQRQTSQTAACNEVKAGQLHAPPYVETKRPRRVCEVSGSCLVQRPRYFIDSLLKAVPRWYTRAYRCPCV